jgi:Protein of unknown function (DUF3800)
MFAFDAKEKLMTFITGYFDESYNYQLPASRIYTVAGYVSVDYCWVEFQKHWKAVLDREGLPPFSMKHFDNGRHEIYGTWDQAKKDSFISELHTIIKKTYIQSVSASVVVDDYDNLSEIEKYGLGPPHLLATTKCLKLIKDWADRSGINESILYVFERGSADDKLLNHAFSQVLAHEIQMAYRIKSFTFQDKDFIPLQSADVLAYETRKEVGRLISNPKNKDPRSTFVNLTRDHLERDDWIILDKKELNRIVNSPQFKAEQNEPSYKAKFALATKRKNGT